MKIYNTYSRKKEELIPLRNNHIGIYTCGPTVYNHAHLGNFRAYIFEDLLKRTLKYLGFTVTHIMNLTDVEDKIINKCIEEGSTPQQYTEKYIKGFFEDLDTLNIERADCYPKATEHIDEMVAIIKTLRDKGYTYEREGNIFFKISEFQNYGNLSGMDLTRMVRGERVVSDDYEKEDVRDFALWKAPKDKEFFWETEIGPGRPGWHIECSAMSSKYLGTTFDIHCGGVDNIFPHHENEIAQSEAASGQKFVRYWMHNEHLIVDGEKMSKSKGNFYTVKDLIAKNIDPSALRYLLLSVHYRKQLNFTLDAVKNAEKTVARLRDFYGRMKNPIYREGRNNGLSEVLMKGGKDFIDALSDDLNVSEALGSLFLVIKEFNIAEDKGELLLDNALEMALMLEDTDRILGVISVEGKDEINDTEIDSLIEERVSAKKAKDFKRADEIRDILKGKGIVLEDTQDGTRWKKI